MKNKEKKEEFNKKILEIIVCPKCKGDLVYDEKENKLVCFKCRLKYKIEDGIINLMIEEAEKF